MSGNNFFETVKHSNIGEILKMLQIIAKEYNIHKI